MDFELIKVSLVHFVSKGVTGSITLLVNVCEALEISVCCSKKLVVADLAGRKFTFSD